MRPVRGHAAPTLAYNAQIGARPSRTALTARISRISHYGSHRDARAHRHPDYRPDHLRAPEAARAGAVTREEPAGVQTGVERAEEHAGRRNPGRRAAAEAA